MKMTNENTLLFNLSYLSQNKEGIWWNFKPMGVYLAKSWREVSEINSKKLF